MTKRRADSQSDDACTEGNERFELLAGAGHGRKQHKWRVRTRVCYRNTELRRLTSQRLLGSLEIFEQEYVTESLDNQSASGLLMGRAKFGEP